MFSVLRSPQQSNVSGCKSSNTRNRGARNAAYEASAIGQIRILVIDDDLDAARAAAMRFRAAGHWVALQHDGISGIRCAIDERPDAILLDLHMQGTDGLTTLAWLLEHRATAAIPIIVFSADRMMRHQAMLNGASDFVDKPYPPHLLLNTVHSVLPSSGHNVAGMNDQCDVRDKWRETIGWLDVPGESSHDQQNPPTKLWCFHRRDE